MTAKRVRKRRSDSVQIGLFYDQVQRLIDSGSLFQETDKIDIEDVAKAFGVTPQTVRRWVKNKVIPGHINANGKIFFFRKDFDSEYSPDNKIFTCKEVAQQMNVKPKTVADWIRQEKLLAKKFCGKWQITKNDLQDFLDVGHG